MKQVFDWIKTNKTTVVGIITVLYGGLSAYLLSQNYVSPETLTIITSILAGLGLIAAKDANKHSTSEQVQKADIKKIEAEIEKEKE